MIFYKTSVMTPKPVPGALEGVKALRDLGYKLVVVTARHTEQQLETQEWIDQYFPGEGRGSQAHLRAHILSFPYTVLRSIR